VDRIVAGRVIESALGADRLPLSVRELQVATLVAAGATNREIAAALSIAPKTVSAHVEHILRKLGAARRTEIAAWAAVQIATRARIGGRSAELRAAEPGGDELIGAAPIPSPLISGARSGR